MILTSLCRDQLFHRDVLLRHFDVYFQFYFHIPCLGFLHPASTYLDIEEERLAPNIGAAVCAVTSRIMSPGQEKQPFAARCVDQIDFHIFRNIDSFFRQNAHDNLIILALAIWNNLTEAQWNKVWMYLAMAARAVTALQLNWDEHSGAFIKQESSRRLVWFVYIVDRLLSGGYDEHIVLRDEFMHIRLPYSNDAFREGKPTPAPQPSDQKQEAVRDGAELSMNGLHIRINRIRHQILGVTKRFVSPPASHPLRPRLEPSQVMKMVNGLQMQLNSFNEAIPEQFKFSEANVHRNFKTTESAGYIMLHTLYWQLHIDLYRFSVPGIREEANHELTRQLPKDFLLKSQKQAVGYAVSLARFWHMLQDFVADKAPGTERLLTADHTMAVCVNFCTKLLLAARQHQLYHDLQENSSAPLLMCAPVTDEVLGLLIESNMNMLRPYVSLMPRLEGMMQDLRASIDNIKQDSTYDDKIGLPAVEFPEKVKLPGPHYVLENILVQQSKEEDDESRRRDLSVADKWFRPRPMAESSTRGPPGHEQGGSAGQDIPPEIPVHLAAARGCRTLPPAPTYNDAYVHPNLQQSFAPQNGSFGFAPPSLWPMHQGYNSMASESIDPMMYSEPPRYQRAVGSEATITLGPYLDHRYSGGNFGAQHSYSHHDYR